MGVALGPAGGAALDDGLLAEADLIARVQDQVPVVGALAGGDLERLDQLHGKGSHMMVSTLVHDNPVKYYESIN